MHFQPDDAQYTVIGGVLAFAIKMSFYAETVLTGLITGAAGALGAFLIKRYLLDRFSKKKR